LCATGVAAAARAAAAHRVERTGARPAAVSTPRDPGDAARAARRVALLVGCVHGELYPRMHEATVRVLARLGYEVTAPARRRAAARCTATPATP